MAHAQAPLEPLVVVMGSTATGKSDVRRIADASPAVAFNILTRLQLAVEIAQRFNGEVVNADAMQLYRGLPVITNQLSTEEQRGIPHHLLGRIDLNQTPWVVHDFRSEANKVIREIRSRGKLPVIVGGSQYYIDGLLFENNLIHRGDARPSPAFDDGDDLGETHPILDAPTETLYEKLLEVDPVMANRWHPKDRRKIRRSLGLFLATGRRASDIYAEQKQVKENMDHSPWRSLLLWVYSDPEVLKARIRNRVDKMQATGLRDETQNMFSHLQSKARNDEAVDRTRGIWQSIGFAQMEPFLEAASRDAPPGELAKLEASGIEDIKLATVRYARTQVKWIRMKTLSLVRDADALDHLFVLDSTDPSKWDENVSQLATRLSQGFLQGETLPSPLEISQTAHEVLSPMIAALSQDKSQPRVRKCEVCDKIYMTEESWETHIKSKKHRRSTQYKKRRALVPVEAYAGRREVITAADADDILNTQSLFG
jgi:tRNA dimethylallyltransferase